MPDDTIGGAIIYHWPFETYATYSTASTNTVQWPFTITMTTTSNSTSTILTQWPFQYQLGQPGSLLRAGTAEDIERAQKEHQRITGEWGREMAQRRAQYLAEQAEVEKRQKAAAAKAEALLLSVLDETQQDSLKKHGLFEVVSRSGRRYRVYRGTHGNVYELSAEGKVRNRLCIQPDGVPTADAMVAQKLMIELDEEGFRRTANISRADEVGAYRVA